MGKLMEIARKYRRKREPESMEDYELNAKSPIQVCVSPNCAGCYVVDDVTGAKIHPPKISDAYRRWLERWEPTGKPQ
jgi:hypothetical protein